MEQCGVIVGLDAGNAIVSIKRDTACGKCKVCPSNGENEVLITIPNNVNVQPGDRVAIAMEPSKILKAAAIAYCIPLIGLVAGVVAGVGVASQLKFDSELSGVAGGILFTMLTFFGIKLFEPYIRGKGCFEPKIAYRLEKFAKGEEKDGN